MEAVMLNDENIVFQQDFSWKFMKHKYVDMSKLWSLFELFISFYGIR